jgi:hypothetical protein
MEEQWRKDANCRAVLNHGLGLVLLDGLDEVRNRDFRSVRRAIEEFAQDFPLCTIALTCRIAAREYSFESFTEVEMADFDNRQIASFSSRWFLAQNEPKKSIAFMEKLKDNAPVLELASNPLLLTLLCLVFQDRNDFNGTRGDLYKQGLDILLYRWDARRDIERDFPIGITKAVLEPLLSEVAYTRFIKGEYFFDQESLEEQIGVFLRKRATAQTPEIPDLTQILHCIEANIGLLVTRAVNIYSFSHLTFQEYLTAQQVVRKPSLLLNMGPHIGDRNWREVWILLSTMLDADDIIVEIKTAIDLLLEGSSAAQEMLRRCAQKADRVSVKKASCRAFYGAHQLSCAIYFDSVLQNFKHARREDSRNESRLPHRCDSPAETLNYRNICYSSFRSDDFGNSEEQIEHELEEVIKYARDIALPFGIELTSEMELDVSLLDVLLRGSAIELAPECPGLGMHILDSLSHARLLASVIDDMLAKGLYSLWAEFGEHYRSGWREKSYPGWLERLRTLISTHRDIEDYWTHSERDTALILQYFRANQLLLDCISAAEGLTTEIRQRVESTMFLPYEEIPEIEN